MTDEEIIATLARVEENLKQVQKGVDKLTHVLLEGNGTPAITVQVATLNEKVGNIEESRANEARESGNNGRARMALYGTLGGAAIGGLFELVRQLIS